MGRDGLQAVRLHQGQLREGKEARPRHQDVPGKELFTNDASSVGEGGWIIPDQRKKGCGGKA